MATEWPIVDLTLPLLHYLNEYSAFL